MIYADQFSPGITVLPLNSEKGFDVFLPRSLERQEMPQFLHAFIKIDALNAVKIKGKSVLTDSLLNEADVESIAVIMYPDRARFCGVKERS